MMVTKIADSISKGVLGAIPYIIAASLLYFAFNHYFSILEEDQLTFMEQVKLVSHYLYTWFKA